MSEEVVETAKAVQGLAKTAETAITAGRKLGEFVSRTIAEPLKETMGILTDRLQFMRWERWVRLVDKVEEIIEERKLQGKTRVVPPKIALPIIENASLEEDDFLQDMWVNLLISAMDESREMPRTAYIEIIKVLTPADAQLLKLMHSEFELQRDHISPDYTILPSGAEVSFRSPSRLPMPSMVLMKTLSASDRTAFEVSMDNLVRVGCATFYKERHVLMMDGLPESNNKSICITSLGISFVDTCIRDME